MVVEESQFTDYLNAFDGDRSKLLVLDQAYKRSYELCDDLGLTKSTGSGPARNFIWDHSISEGHDWHWIMDDNIFYFFRANHNYRIEVLTPAYWLAMESFVLRYSNVAMAGPNYCMFSPRKTKVPPFVPNTRIFSCNLIRNDVPFRWRGRYNEDAILSLDMLKAGWCTILFNAYLQHKCPTQIMGGGNSAEFYFDEGTLPKSQMLVSVHPDVTRLVKKWGRWHHHVDYLSFRRNRLIKRDDFVMPTGPNEFNMRFQEA